MSRLPQVAALAAVALLGGVAALGGAALLGAFDGGTTTVLTTAAPREAAPAAAARTLTVNQIYRRSGSGVVQISTGEATGSGFVVDKAGHIVTNYHVIEGADRIDVSFSNRDTLDAVVVGSDPSTDLALLRVDASARALAPLPLADSDAVQVGDPVVAIGNPFGLERTVTSGIVSALQRAVIAPNGYTIDHVIQTDAPINRGNSGGPLLNARGEVIGVNSQIATGGTGEGNVGIGFAVPSNTVKTVVAQLLKNGRVDRPYLGVTVTPVNSDLARLFRLPVDTGVLVQNVQPGGAADAAGVRGGTQEVVLYGESYVLGGDLIVGVGGTRVTSVDELRRALAELMPGDDVEVELYRGNERRTVTVRVGRQPAGK